MNKINIIDIPCKDIKGEFLLVRKFLPIASIENNKIKRPTISMPYAVLSVECPSLKDKYADIYLNVENKMDFRHLWELYQERKVGELEEVIVSYSPIGLKWLWRAFPYLHIRVKPIGCLKEIYQGNFSNYYNIRTLAEWLPMKGRII
jgi:hypothetical protein